VRLNSLDAQYEKIVFIVQIYNGEKLQRFGKVQNAFIRAVDARNIEMARFDSGGPAFASQRSMVFAELIREATGWKLRAIGEPSESDSFVAPEELHVMRRLPVYLVIDTSGSMRGESIHSVNVGIQAMLSALRQDPYALESVHISIITYDNGAREFIPLTPLEDFQFSDIVVPSAGGTFTGAALECLMQCVERDVRRSDGDTKRLASSGIPDD
jgi:hypothetical protein